ncbi:pentatricopeptide repeat-containing protein At5g61370, mitochondrial-like isoform X2 [Triticum dicoccoides]|uniref:pentatricopeptide repeat-containing protein At5g61370, mitochondrial-like isoform X2 n=2 Tax=Triticum dicoccoides TaxID=85692 RepID=UPI00188E84D0|nr:pentatricopeptide repeat-containing protein At5g61370, mitochondrial-like isoform X2 [Triticum dicoccoides]
MATVMRRSVTALSLIQSSLAPRSRLGRCRIRRAMCSGAWQEGESEAAVRDVVCFGSGSLDEVGSRLDRLNLAISPALVRRVIDSCSERSDSGRRLLRFLSWCRSKDLAGLGDEEHDRAIAVLARMGDLTAMKIAVGDGEKDGRRMAPETFTAVVEALVKAGKEDEAVRLFRGLERQKLLPQQGPGAGGEGIWCSSLAMVQTLCMKGYAREAQGVVWHHKSKLSAEPMVSIVQRSLLHGWCVHGNAKEARRVLDDIKSSGCPLGLPSFNDFLNCVCNRNLKFNPSALVSEAMDILTEMRSYGVTPDSSSFNILLSCLGRARRVKEAYRILYLMREGEEGCSPDWVSYYLVVKVLYLTDRIIRGKRLVEDMLESGVLPTAKFFHGLIGILCGTEKVDHALDMFRIMKSCELADTHTYDLLIEKLSRNGRFEVAKELWDDATKNGIVLGCSSDLLDPLKTEVFRPVRPAQRQTSQNSSLILMSKFSIIKYTVMISFFFCFKRTSNFMDISQEQQQDFGVLLKQGAEGRVFVSTFVGRKCVIKERFSKKYRHPLLDSKLTLKRLNAEARCMTKARRLGVPTPVLYAVDPLQHTLTFEYVDGLCVKDILLGFGSNGINEERLNDIATQIGNAVGKLHDGGLVHGDLTTSNMMIKNSTNQLVLIDFGLSFTSTIPEDKAVDLYVLERALISMHSSCGGVMEKILAAYRKASRQWCATTNKLAQVRQRGRKRTMVG